jgi:two-component system, sensor histidine kinase
VQTNQDCPKILIVNDDPASLLAMTGLLAQWSDSLGYQVATARSGEEALRQVLQHEFAVILLDVHMPGMDGFETAEAIHQHPRSAETPIIFVTALLADELHRLKGYQKGAVDYLFTPIIPPVLKAKISVFVTLATKNLKLKYQTEALKEHSAALSVTNDRLQVEIEERKKAEQENRAKDEFLAMLGHELRNPLSAISNAVAIIDARGDGTESNRRAKEIIQRQSRHLSHIIDDLLDLGRVWSGKISLDKRPLELSRLVDECVETLHATGRTASYTLQIQKETVWLDADPTRIEQIVVNLLDNALKYTPAGGNIDIAIHAENNDAVLTVRDSGVGIAADLLPNIFEVFVQGADSLDRAQGGLGIGLALVRQLATLHGGTIAADSAGMAQGSIFTVRLPRIPHADPAAPVAEPAAHPQHCRVLIVEDNEDGREMMSIMLSAYDYQVLQAADGLEGLRVATSDKPDVALVDIGLPGLDGFEVARRLRADPATSAIKLIALTGYGQEKDRYRAMQAGFDLYLIKPVGTDQLLEAIQSCSGPQART